MCLSMSLDAQPARDLDEPTRRLLLKRLTAAGLTLPLAMAALDKAVQAGPMSYLDRGELLTGLEDLVAKARSPMLASYRLFEMNSKDMPWKDIDVTLGKGQEVTFLLGGRLWASREHDLWFEPGTAFNVRTRGRRPIYNAMHNTGTMTAAHDGPIEIARSLGEFKDEDGDLFTPAEAYQAIEVDVYGIALVWQGPAVEGLKSLAAHGDVGGVLNAEIARLESPRKLPDGWHNHFVTGGDAVIFNDIGNGQVSCQAHKNAGLLLRPVSVPLKSGTKLNWRWIVEELPSLIPEDQVTSHDYLSIAAEYDDGQDLTYIWSAGLPVGQVFRCPFPRWAPIESHMVVRTGYGELGQWLDEERDLYEDYKAHIGGPATEVVRIWLLGVSLFQRRHGACRFADMAITGPDNFRIDLA